MCPQAGWRAATDIAAPTGRVGCEALSGSFRSEFGRGTTVSVSLFRRVTEYFLKYATTASEVIQATVLLHLIQLCKIAELAVTVQDQGGIL